MNELILVTGAYGSGKSEYAVNLAWEYSEAGENVMLVDLDVVNPYFRSRDVREQFADKGIDVVAPEGEFKHADLPMLSPRIAGAVQNQNACVILDVGGDPAGCRTLARYVRDIKARGYQMRFVVNTRRPFTSNAADIIEMKTKLEYAAGLGMTELVCNTNLMDDTTPEIVEEGIKIVNQVAQQTGLKFNNYLALDTFANQLPAQLQGKERYLLRHYLLKPWEATVNPYHNGVRGI